MIHAEARPSEGPSEGFLNVCKADRGGRCLMHCLGTGIWGIRGVVG